MKRACLILSFFSSLCFFAVGVAFYPSAAAWAQDGQASTLPGEDLSAKNSSELVKMAWAASNRADYPNLEKVFEQILSAYEGQAMALQASLSGFPERDKVEDFRIMNDVAVVVFIHAEALMHQGKTLEAIKAFEELIREYPSAQSWDASRGSYWSVAEKSRASINAMNGLDESALEVVRAQPTSVPVLITPGKDRVVDYRRYGKFTGIGTKDYKFHMFSQTKLSRAVGEGIYPNTGDVYKNSRLKDLYKEDRQKGSQWDYVNTKDLEAAYFKWSTALENPGVKLFYTAMVFEKSKMYLEAIKAYHALVVHFPTCSGMTYWNTPWYPAQAAVAKIKYILRQHPELGLVYRDAKVRVYNGNDANTANDVFVVWPGIIEKGSSVRIARRQVNGIKQIRGGKRVRFVQYKNGHWQMQVNGKPFMIKGTTYAPTKIGQSPDKGTLENWMTADSNGNGRTDGPYDSWVDSNRNGRQDADEPVVGDFQLLKEMGLNALRIYHNGRTLNKELLRELYTKYGISVVLGDFLGKYTLGSGAEWSVGTDYENPVHLANMMKSVEQMVNDFKNEPFVLMWNLGNENNYGVGCNADKKPEAFYKFVNAVAKRIKELDPTRAVGITNGDLQFLDLFNKVAPYVDVVGANVYRGDYGFGSFWDEVRILTDRPALITEYGAPAYSRGSSREDAEQEQMDYHRGNWMDIAANSAFSVDGEGNSVGGFAFEWMDEWWKNYEPSKHDTKADVIGPFAGGYYYEEWFGLCGQGDGANSPFLRDLRKVYFMYKDMWNEK